MNIFALEINLNLPLNIIYGYKQKIFIFLQTLKIRIFLNFDNENQK